MFCAESSEDSVSGLNRQQATNKGTPSSKRNDVDMGATTDGNIPCGLGVSLKWTM